MTMGVAAGWCFRRSKCWDCCVGGRSGVGGWMQCDTRGSCDGEWSGMCLRCTLNNGEFLKRSHRQYSESEA